MKTFAITPVERFAGSSAAMRRPREIACFSYDDNHDYYPDGRSLRYYYPAKLGSDLSQGFDTFHQLDDSRDDHLDSLLRRIMTWEQDNGAKCEADFITWRGMMTKILATPGDNMFGSGFEMNAMLFQGTIFIEEDHDSKLRQRTSQKAQPARPGNPSQDLMAFWGYKFETLSLLSHDWHTTPRESIEARPAEIVNNHAQYCSIVKTGIGPLKMVLGGEVDGVWDAKPKDETQPINWVELKTSACIESDRDMLKYERKLQKFWIQSFLLGVPKIIVGFRTRHGILDHLEELDTAKIPGQVKRHGKGSWDGNICINFAAAFLSWLRESITEGCVWRIRRRERSSEIELLPLQAPQGQGILSEDFLAWRTQELSRAEEPEEKLST